MQAITQAKTLAERRRHNTSGQGALPKLLVACLAFASIAEVKADGLVAAGGNRIVRFDATTLVQGVGVESIDLSRFEKAGYIAPGKYQLEIYVNGRWRGTQELTYRAAEDDLSAQPCYDINFLQRAGVDVQKSERFSTENGREPLANNGVCEDLALFVPGAIVKTDIGEQQLYLTVPTYYLDSRQSDNSVDPASWDNGVTAARLNYNANLGTTQTNAGRSSRGYAGLTSGLNVGAWRLRQYGTLTWSSAGGASYQRGQLYATTEVAPWRSQVQIGEISTDGTYFDAVSFRGLRLSSDERMLPARLRTYAPVVRGTATSNATVSVRQRGYLIYEVTVPAGPFALDDLPAASYGGDLAVTVTEADGSARHFVVPFATGVELLRPGTSRYSVSVGRAMSALNQSSGQSIFEGMLRVGLSDRFTGFGGLALSEHYRSAMGGLAMNTAIGAISGDLTMASANLPGGGSTSGASYRATYSKNLPNSGTNFSLLAYRYSTPGYIGFSDALALRDTNRANVYTNLGSMRHRLDLNISQNLGTAGGVIFANGSAQQYWRRTDSMMSYSLGYSNQWRSAFYSFSLQRTQSAYPGSATYSPRRYKNTLMTFNVSIPLGRATSSSAPVLNTFISNDSESGSTISTGVGGSLGESRDLSYAISAARSGREGARSTSASLNYRTSLAHLGASVSQGTGYRQGTLQASGSVLAHRGGITFAPMLGETVGLLYAPDAEDAKISSGASRIDRRGYGLITSLSPYRLNTVELNPGDMSDDVELLASSRSIAPTAGAVVLLSYPTRKARLVLIDGRLQGGTALPFGAEVFDADSGESLGGVGQGSRIVMRTPSDQGVARVAWGAKPEQQCLISYSLPQQEPGKQDGYVMLSSTCLPMPAAPRKPAPLATR